MPKQSGTKTNDEGWLQLATVLPQRVCVVVTLKIIPVSPVLSYARTAVPTDTVSSRGLKVTYPGKRYTEKQQYRK